jgi:hypothetical protein
VSYFGYLNGHEYQVVMTQDPDVVKLLSRDVEPADGDFVERRPGVWVRQVRLEELDGLYDVTLHCEYKGHPFVVTADLGDDLGVQYVGGDIRVARELGLSIDEPLVATGFVRAERGGESARGAASGLAA